MKKGGSRIYLIVLAFLAVLAAGSLLLLDEKVNVPYLAGQKTPLIKGFPQVPIYPNAALIDSRAEGEGDKIKHSGIWEVNASVQEAGGWYKDELQKSGWFLDVAPSDINDVKTQMYVYKKENLILNLSIMADLSLTRIIAEFSTPAFAEEEGEED